MPFLVPFPYVKSAASGAEPMSLTDAERLRGQLIVLAIIALAIILKAISAGDLLGSGGSAPSHQAASVQASGAP